MTEHEKLTLYRVENPNIPADPRLEAGGTSHPELKGQWFTDRLDKALNYMPKAVRYKPEGSKVNVVIDGAVVKIAQILTSDTESYRAVNHPVVQATGMDIEPTEDFIIPNVLVVDEVPIDALLGDAREGINRHDEQRARAVHRVRGAVALKLSQIPE